MPDQTALRDRRERYAAPLYALMRQNGWDGERTEQVVREMDLVLDAVISVADAELAAVLPARADRAAVLREAADELGRMDYDTDSRDYGYDTYRDAWNGGVMDGADLLRRMADEAPSAVPALTPCICRQAVHDREHAQPVTGCPWCAARQEATR